MKRAVIICNGALDGDEAFIRSIVKDSTVICADGGVVNATRIGIKPDIIIGDMDSAPSELIDKYKDIVIEDKDENSTDSEKALNYAIDNGFSQVILLAATGDRIDHTVSNLFLLEKYPDLDLHIVDASNDIFLAKNMNELKCKKGEVISLIPLSDVTGLELEGLKYKADKLSRSIVGVHNVATGTQVKISFDKGTLLIDRVKI